MKMRNPLFETVGQSVLFSQSSSYPRATNRALISGPFFRRTQVVEIVNCPTSLTSSYVLKSFNFCNSSCFARRHCVLD